MYRCWSLTIIKSLKFAYIYIYITSPDIHGNFWKRRVSLSSPLRKIYIYIYINHSRSHIMLWRLPNGHASLFLTSQYWSTLFLSCSNSFGFPGMPCPLTLSSLPYQVPDGIIWFDRDGDGDALLFRHQLKLGRPYFPPEPFKLFRYVHLS